MFGQRLLRLVEAGFVRVDRAIHAGGVAEELNPFAQSGAVANTSLAIAIVSGVVLLIWYSPSVHLAYTSLEALRHGAFLGQWLRSLHRYSSDLCMLFVLYHAARMFVSRRFGGARWLAWVTGIALLGALWVVGWIGYWLVWDTRAQQVALGSTRVLDVLPIFGDPPSRSFLTDGSVSSILFFIIFFAHMLLPLAMGIALWLHITRLSRSKFFTRRALTLLLVGALAVVSILVPAVSAGPARMTASPGAFRFDAWYLLPLALTDRLSGGVLVTVVLLSGALLTAIPWLLVRGRAVPTVVNTSKCNACRRCAEDCPYLAVTMVPRTDGRGFEVQAQVDPAKCIGCGICSGSCDSSAINLPWLDVVAQRARLDAWLDDAAGDGATNHVAFACAESAGGALDVDPDTGRCEALPGYRVLAVPCIGWVHHQTAERALRHGAAGVLLVGCAPGTCMYREGVEWTKQRLEGTREPALGPETHDASRVRLVQFDRLDRKALGREAAAFRAGTSPPKRAPGRARALATGTVVAVVLGVATLAIADAPYGGPPPIGPELVVSFKHPGQLSENCRVVTPQENQSVPVHMRRDRICERGRASVRLRVRVDGVVVLERAFSPGGIRHDEPSLALVHVPVAEGTHTIALEIGETHDAHEWTFRDTHTLDFRRGHRGVVLFDRSRLFAWE